MKKIALIMKITYFSEKKTKTKTNKQTKKQKQKQRKVPGFGWWGRNKGCRPEYLPMPFFTIRVFTNKLIHLT